MWASFTEGEVYYFLLQYNTKIFKVYHSLVILFKLTFNEIDILLTNYQVLSQSIAKTQYENFRCKFNM